MPVKVAIYTGCDALGIFTGRLPEMSSQHNEVVELYDQLRPALFGYLISLGLARLESDDVIQETFLRLYRFLASGGKLHHSRSWIFRIAHNLAQNLPKREERLISDNSEIGHATTCARPTTIPSAEEVYLSYEQFEGLEAALSQLTEHQQACLQLRAVGLRYKEIAEVLGIKVSAVEETLKRAVLRLMSEP